MSDAQEIHSLLSDEQYESVVESYKDSQIEYVNDFNNGNYSSGQINFDTQNINSKWICWKEAWLQIPLNIVSSGTAYDATTLQSFKSSVLSFITGINISTSGGSPIVAENYISLINNLRLLIEKEFEWSVQESHSLIFSKDTLTTPSSTTMGGSCPANTSTTNSGFLSRIQMLKTQVGAASTTTWSMVLNIPLRYLHDFFEQLSFPMINSRFQFTFNIATNTNGHFNAWCCNSVGPVPTPTLSIGSASSNGQSITSCRLYYKSVQFQPEVQSKLVSKLESGYTKKVFFRSTDTYLPQSTELGVTGGTVSKVLNSNTVSPLRVWLLAPPASGLSTAGSDTVNGAFVFPGTFTNMNVLINNSPYYTNSLNTIAEQWAVLSEQFPGHGSSNSSGGLISYNDFISSHRLNCFDISRLKNRLSDPNASVGITVQATRVNSVACDYYIVVERLNAVNFLFSASETKMVVGL